MSFQKRKAAIIGAVLSAVLSATILGSSLSYAASGNYQNWKQYGSAWSSMTLGKSGETVSRSGCAVTSAAILMVQSGSVTDNNFTPGVIIDYLNQHGGFQNTGAINWGVLTSYAPDFKFVQGADLSGTQAQKAEKIKKFLDAGYYVIAAVKYGGHFVAINSVEGDYVTMHDPGSEKTSLFDTYPASGIVSLRVFKGTNSNVTVTPVTKPTVITNIPETAPSVPETMPVLSEIIPPETAPEVIATIPAETTAVQTAPPVMTSTETTATEIIMTTNQTTTQTVTTSQSVEAQTAPAIITTAETTATTTKPASTDEIVITTKPMTSTEAVTTTVITEIPASIESSNSEIIIDPIEEAETDSVIDIILLEEAPSTAPEEEASASIPAETVAIYIPEEQAEAALFKIKEQNLFMQVRFHIHENVNLRETPDTDSQILAVIPADTCLDVVEVDEEFKWGKVAFEGKEGWISLHFAGL